VTETPILDLFEDVWGSRPSRIAASCRAVTADDLERLIEAWLTATSHSTSRRVGASQIWPLISHHTYGGRALFGLGSGMSGSVLPRALTILLAHDGIMAADPIAEIARLHSQGHVAEALANLSDLLADLASVEPLIEHDVLRFTSQRPGLAAEVRKGVLDFFGVDPSLQVFTNFLEAAVFLESSVTAEELPSFLSESYFSQVGELFGLMGLAVPRIETIDDAAAEVGHLAAAMIEVSWQIAVCAENPACDIALAGPTELALMESLLEDAPATDQSEVWAGQLGRTRHFQRLSLGQLPNLSAGALTVADAVSLRRYDAFEQFRSQLRSALDVFDEEIRSGQKMYLARARFEEQMTDAAGVLSRSIQRTSLKDRLQDSTVPAAIGAIPTVTFAEHGAVALAGATAAFTALSTAFWQWLTGRSTPDGIAIGVRYLAMLGGQCPEPRRDSAPGK
jgi:hypothetical protein